VERRRGGAPASVMTSSREAATSSREAHRHTKKVVRRCSGFGDDSVVGGGSGIEVGGIKGGIEGGSPVYEEGSGGAEVGQPDGAKPRDSAIRVSRWRGYCPYT
jgi:hypothetical protein